MDFFFVNSFKNYRSKQKNKIPKSNEDYKKWVNERDKILLADVCIYIK